MSQARKRAVGRNEQRIPVYPTLKGIKMKIYSIADLHLDARNEKPMDVFGEIWMDHDKKIFDHWQKVVKEEDLVLLPGDISWALALRDAEEDLKKIDGMPGRKVITKGNHDFWWSSMRKLRALGLQSIFFMHNNSYSCENIEVYGTRGWISQNSEDFKKEDEVIHRRELIRLENSIKSAPLHRHSLKIAMIHYPPIDGNGGLNDFGEKILEYATDICVYGHLHGLEAHKRIKETTIGGTRFVCVAADYLAFELKEIGEVTK